jgi:dihydropteroate synthase
VTASVRRFEGLDRCRVMGVVNVTQESFSPGGTHGQPKMAIQDGIDMIASGADIIDIGGESIMPGGEHVDAAEELRRVVPVVAELASSGVKISVDTTRAIVAAESLDAGATLINDVSFATQEDLLSVVAERGAPYVLVHNGVSRETPGSRSSRQDRVQRVASELSERIEFIKSRGIAEDQIIIDPGIGFGKGYDEDLLLLANLDQLSAIGRPLLIGASRKDFIGQLLAEPADVPQPDDRRDAATQAVTALVAAAGAWAVRVHNVPPAVDAVLLARAWARARI